METKEEHLNPLTKAEIVNIIGLLTAQLADETLINNHHGDCPPADPMILFIKDNKETIECFNFGDRNVGTRIVIIAKQEADSFIKGLIDILVGKEEIVTLNISNADYNLTFKVM